jgi:hypothetical protein
MLRGRCGPTSPLPRTAFTVAAHHSDAPLLSQRESFTLINPRHGELANHAPTGDRRAAELKN